MSQSVYVVGSARTPIGSFLGSLADLPAPRLGAIAIQAALKRGNVAPEFVNEVFFGNVLQAAIGQAPARQAALFAGLPNTVPCTTINKVCGSGLQSIIVGTKNILLGDADVVVCGGMESMSNVPYYLPKARGGMRMGHGEVTDGLICDGLWDPYKNFHMGNAGELCASKFQFSREAQDAFAAESYRKALSAQTDGKFNAEICPVEIPQRKGDPIQILEDEEPKRGGSPAKMAQLRPAFAKDGTITAANASKIDDGACAVILASENAVKQHGLKPVARILGYSSAAHEPEWFTTAPAVSISKVLSKLGLSANDIDLFEINEAFSVVAMHAILACNLDPAKVNVHGGAVALGHPLGCSGARIVTTLLHALADRKLSKGLATLCIGGGEALALVLERV